MKRIFTILMLVAAVLVGGTTVDAKTTKKKAKAKTTQTSSSALWNGDMPTAKNLLENMESLSPEFAKKGYRVLEEGHMSWSIIKNGICSIEWMQGMSYGDLIITVFDTSKLNWLYEDLKKAIRKNKGYSVSKEGNVIDVCVNYYPDGRP